MNLRGEEINAVASYYEVTENPEIDNYSYPGVEINAVASYHEATENPEINNYSYPGYQLDVTNSAIENLKLSQAHCNELENKLKFSTLEIKTFQCSRYPDNLEQK